MFLVPAGTWGRLGQSQDISLQILPLISRACGRSLTALHHVWYIWRRSVFSPLHIADWYPISLSPSCHCSLIWSSEGMETLWITCYSLETANIHDCVLNAPIPFCQVRPLSGPLEGGTLLTVQGRNLGRRAKDVSVDIGGVPCFVLENQYKVSQRWVTAPSLPTVDAVRITRILWKENVPEPFETQPEPSGEPSTFSDLISMSIASVIFT